MAMSLLNSVPASEDTLFMRGFSTRQRVEDIREFFDREGGRNLVEFFKETDDKEHLFIALKFDSRKIAKEILNRFDNCDVLGDRINISYFKDLRRANKYGNNEREFRRPYNNRQWSPDNRYNNEYRGYQGGSGGGGQYQNRRMYNHNQNRPWQGDRSDRSDRNSGGGSSRPRRYTRSSSHSKSRSPSMSASRSHSRSRSSSGDASRSRSRDSKERTRKRKRSLSGGKRKSKGAKPKSSSPDHGSTHSESSTPRVKASAAGKKKSADRTPSLDRKAAKAAKKKEKTALESDDQASSAAPDVGSDAGEYMVEVSPPPPSQLKAAIRSQVTTVAKKRGQKQAAADAEETSETADAVGNDSAKKDVATKGKKVKEDRRLFEEQISDDEDNAGKARKSKDDQGDDEFSRGRHVDDPSAVDMMYDSDEPRGGRKRKSGPQDADEFEQPSMDDEDEVQAELREMVDMKRRRRPNDPMRGDGRMMRGMSSRKRSAFPELSAINGSQLGAVGLAQDKMGLIREKKEDIEKAYRQDCETFATVTKMLISKDPELEERIQGSLRENLKEIGQRCIQELREFIDRLKTEDDA